MQTCMSTCMHVVSLVARSYTHSCRTPVYSYRSFARTLTRAARTLTRPYTRTTRTLTHTHAHRLTGIYIPTIPLNTCIPPIHSYRSVQLIPARTRARSNLHSLARTYIYIILHTHTGSHRLIHAYQQCHSQHLYTYAAHTLHSYRSVHWLTDPQTHTRIATIPLTHLYTNTAHTLVSLGTLTPPLYTDTL